MRPHIAGGIADQFGAFLNGREAVYLEVRRRIAAVAFILMLAIPIVVYLAATDDATYELMTHRGRRGRSLPLFMSLSLLTGLVAWIWIYNPIRQARQHLRSQLLPLVFQHVERFSYTNGLQGKMQALMPRKAVGYYVRAAFDDCLTGVYRGLPIELCEIRMSRPRWWARGYVEVFEGICIAFPLDRAPKLRIVARPLRLIQQAGVLLPALGRWRRVKSGAQEIDARYAIYSDDVANSESYIRRRLAPALQWLSQAWEPGKPTLSIAGGEAFLLLPINANFFEFPSGNASINFENYIAPIVRQVEILMRTALAVHDMLADETGKRA